MAGLSPPPPAMARPDAAFSPPPAPAPEISPFALPQATPTAAAPMPSPDRLSTSGAGSDEVLRAFCEGAGLSPMLAKGQDGVELARDLGRCMRIATDEVMRMLRDRANVKQFTKGGARTMLSASRNNPLKFMPDSDQALEAMFLAQRDGFMTGPEALQVALKDLRAHQMGVFAALQPALAAVLEGLSPEEIDQAETTGGLLAGSRKGKMWDEFVRRWDERSQAGDHGMLDVFLLAFAKAYVEASSRVE